MTTRTAVNDTVLRMAIGLMIADRRSALDHIQRDRYITRLLLADAHGQHLAFTDAERLELRPLLLAYIREHRRSIVAIVVQNFDDLDSACLPL